MQFVEKFLLDFQIFFATLVSHSVYTIHIHKPFFLGSTSWRMRAVSAQNPQTDAQLPTHWGNTTHSIIWIVFRVLFFFFSRRVKTFVPFLQLVITSFSDDIFSIIDFVVLKQCVIKSNFKIQTIFFQPTVHSPDSRYCIEATWKI